MPPTPKALFLALLVGIATTACRADDWTQYRGTGSNTFAPHGRYPTSLTADSAVWSVDLPGPGASSPIVVGGSIVITCEIDGEDGAMGFDAQGVELWRTKLGRGAQAKHRAATGANSTPATDGESIFVYFKSGRLVCLDLEGNERWRRNLQQDFGPDTLWWDLGSSPIVTDAGVLVAVIQAGDSYLVTFDRATGEVVWKTPRQFDRPRESDQAYTTPVLLSGASTEQLVVWGADHLTGHDPATGKQLWSADGFNPQDQPMWRVIASPTIAENIAVVPYGRGGFLAGVRIDPAGDGADRVWTRNDLGSDVPCPVIRDGLIYLLGDGGKIACVDLKTGDPRWVDSLPRTRRAQYFATPLLAGELLYCVRTDGVGYVVRVDADGVEVAGDIDLGDDTVVTPVPLDESRLIVRTRNRLHVFGER